MLCSGGAHVVIKSADTPTASLRYLKSTCIHTLKKEREGQRENKRELSFCLLLSVAVKSQQGSPTRPSICIRERCSSVHATLASGYCQPFIILWKRACALAWRQYGAKDNGFSSVGHGGHSQWGNQGSFAGTLYLLPLAARMLIHMSKCEHPCSRSHRCALRLFVMDWGCCRAGWLAGWLAASTW